MLTRDPVRLIDSGDAAMICASLLESDYRRSDRIFVNLSKIQHKDVGIQGIFPIEGR
jgi:hypothetical protein